MPTCGVRPIMRRSQGVCDLCAATIGNLRLFRKYENHSVEGIVALLTGEDRTRPPGEGNTAWAALASDRAPKCERARQRTAAIARKLNARLTLGCSHLGMTHRLRMSLPAHQTHTQTLHMTFPRHQYCPSPDQYPWVRINQHAQYAHCRGSLAIAVALRPTV